MNFEALKAEIDARRQRAIDETELPILDDVLEGIDRQLSEAAQMYREVYAQMKMALKAYPELTENIAFVNALVAIKEADEHNDAFAFHPGDLTIEL